MADNKTTSQENQAALPLIGAELIRGVQTSGNVKFTAQDVANLFPGATTTVLASSIDANKGAGLVGYSASVNYLSNTIGFALNVSAGAITSFSDPNNLSKGDALVAVKQPFTGSFARTQHDKNTETLSVADFLSSAADGNNDNTADIQAAINAAATGGRRLIGSKLHTYLVRDVLTIPSGLEFDLNGASVIDDVRTFRPSNQAGRASALFYMYGVHDVIIKNFVYQSTVTRATLSNSVPTGIIWIGDNSTTGNGPTYNIEISGITASNCANYTLFVGVVGNVYNVHVHDVSISGNCAYGFNAEYGQAPTGPTDAAGYGSHPYDILVERFNGDTNPNCVGFLRVAGVYNVKFLDCYGKEVTNFIYAWPGDSSISRVSESVVFENCTHYASSTFASGVVNYCVQVLSPDYNGSTMAPLPSWTNYDHLFRFVNCQFQNNKTVGSACVRFYGSQGSTVFKSCVLRNSYYGARAEPSANPDYTSFFSLAFDDCVFINNSQDIRLAAIRGVAVKHCKFKMPDGTLVPVYLTNSAINNLFEGNYFTGSTQTSYVVVDAGSVRNEFSYNTFDTGPSLASLALSAETLGQGNTSSPPLCPSTWGYYCLNNQAETQYIDITQVPAAAVDVTQRKQYIALTGSVVKTISEIDNGKLGDEVVFQSASSGASVTFTNLAAVGTLNRILCPGGANLTKSGKLWTVRLKLNEVGWLLMDCP